MWFVFFCCSLNSFFMCLFFQLPISLSFRSHLPCPISQELHLVSPFSPLPTPSFIAKHLPSLSTLLHSFQGGVALPPHPPSCLPDCPSLSLRLSQLRCSSVINHIITPFPFDTSFVFFPKDSPKPALTIENRTVFVTYISNALQKILCEAPSKHLRAQETHAVPRFWVTFPHSG